MIDDVMSLHGDPMYKHGKIGQHLWLKEGEKSPLLEWVSLNGTFQLLGKTLGNKGTGNQWFTEYFIEREGKEVFSASVKGSTKIQVKMDGKAVQEKGTPKAVTMYSSVKPGLRVEAASDDVFITAGDLQMTLSAAEATKFEDEKKRLEFSHLNMKFPKGIPAFVAHGLLAELAGTDVMTASTRALLTAGAAKKNDPRALQA